MPVICSWEFRTVIYFIGYHIIADPNLLKFGIALKIIWNKLLYKRTTTGCFCL